MKFTCSVDINAPREKVVELWQDPNNLQYWQDGFDRMEHVSGVPGEAGAISNMYYQMRGKSMQLIETIVHNNLPDSFEGQYDHESMSNTMRVHFEALDERTTRYITEIHYTQFNGFMVKMMAKLFPGMFKKQSQKWFDQFKDFVEGYE